MNDSRVLASCTVDDLGQRQFSVIVRGEPPFDRMRVYTIASLSINLAAQEGLRLFVEEMEALRDADVKG